MIDGHRARASEAFSQVRDASSTAVIRVMVIGIKELIEVYREEMDDAPQDIVLRNQHAIAQLKSIVRTIESNDASIIPKI